MRQHSPFLGGIVIQSHNPSGALSTFFALYLALSDQTDILNSCGH